MCNSGARDGWLLISFYQAPWRNPSVPALQQGPTLDAHRPGVLNVRIRPSDGWGQPQWSPIDWWHFPWKFNQPCAGQLIWYVKNLGFWCSFTRLKWGVPMSSNYLFSSECFYLFSYFPGESFYQPLPSGNQTWLAGKSPIITWWFSLGKSPIPVVHVPAKHVWLPAGMYILYIVNRWFPNKDHNDW